MLYEFAVDPEAVANWQNFRYVVDNCGLGTGRYISQFPGGWKRLVKEACRRADQPIKQHRIIESLRTIDEKLIRYPRSFDEAKSWFDAAQEAHATDSFQAIVTTADKATGGVDALDVEDLSRRIEKWNVIRGYKVDKTAEDLSAVAFNVLRYSSEIILVDQHYSPKAKYGKPLTKFLEYASEGNSLKRFEYHLNHNGTAEWFSEELEKQRSYLNIPEGTGIGFLRWKWGNVQLEGEKKHHPRYILTEKCGLYYDYGLDEGDPGVQTDVSLLDEEIYMKTWHQFKLASGEFELADAWILTAESIKQARIENGRLVEKV